MTIMLKNYIKFILIIFSLIVVGQEKDLKFPVDFLGVYKGDLTIANAKGKQIIPMEFHLKKTDSKDKFDYVLVYDGNARNYTLITKDWEKGIFEVDENNGIILPSKYYEGTLFSFFEVQKNLLSTRIQFERDKIFFEILFTNTNNKVTSGDQSEKIPEVFGYPISTIQKAQLIKQ